ncbi:Sterol O-acyltransferase 2 (Sterol-ester synthase 2) [Tieghemiomyces parasiticus]|uniref:O-acyltransferase n=1 Tax=Tieghemiomyces parasiticus TaxID=78921 RepID=A0A9W8AG36_9FUNG|nr:Sterol O-acyltransferase 2 (Sterol-ester synthase 2) [Tieghemiomyces parasiticus]
MSAQWKEKSAAQAPGESGTLRLRRLAKDSGASGMSPRRVAREAKIRRNRPSMFKPRTSYLDLTQVFTPDNTGRGWYVLFWMAMICYVVRQVVINFTQTGYPLRNAWGIRLSEHVVELMLADLAVVAYTFLALAWQKLIVHGVCSADSMAAYVVQHILQGLLLGGVVIGLAYADWFWVQTGVLLLHTLVLLMKMHSYISSNRELAIKHARLQELAAEHRDELASSAPDLRAQLGAPSSDDEASVASRRPASLSTMQRPAGSLPSTSATSLSPPESDSDQSPPASVASTHKSAADAVPDWQEEMTDLEEDLTAGDVVYPGNVTLSNFIDYLFVPALVYEIYYPRITKLRPAYLAEKICATFGVFALLHVTFEDYIIPIVEELPRISIGMTILELITPVMISYLLVFYIIFECICNVFAELTRFADRNFYDDWWNSTTFDEFARKWNKPVHHFLLRHIYHYSIDMYKFSRNHATLLTFFLSSCLHELVMIVTVGRVRLYLFGLQMFQLPLIYISRHPVVKNRPLLGNIFFWLSMICGPPMIAVLYCRDHFIS